LRNNKSSKIWLSPPHKSGYEQDFLNEALESNYIAPIGPFIEKFENSLKSYTNSSFAVALNSGTSAIHLALKCIGIKPNDTVFCSTFTFIATANPILYENAIPYFIESEKETWNMCPIFLEKAILKTIAKKQKPAAIILVHLYGNPAKFNEIKSIALKYNIPIIEDAAEALGSTYNNIPCGSLSDLGIISFNGNKIITTSGGGALLTSNEEYAKQVKYLSTQAKEAVLHYEHKAIGFNYRMSNIAAAIGCAQMKVISERVIQRRENFNLYKNFFSNTSISFQNELDLSFSNR
jgi:dTDP-4-amino-4,6-dideoxygalactose transaminase